MEFGKKLENVESGVANKIAEVPQKLVDMFNDLFGDVPGKQHEFDENDALNEEEDKMIEDVAKRNIDDRLEVYKDGDQLKPNTKYMLNGKIYETDNDNNIETFAAILTKADIQPEGERNNSAQLKVGGEERPETHQGSHLLARIFGGDAGIGNLVAMDSRINQGDYKIMENDILRTLKADKIVDMYGKLFYKGDSHIPYKMVVTLEIDGKKSVYTFNNERNMSLIDGEKGIGKAEKNKIYDEVNKTDGGYVSSKVEIYDSDGKLEERVYTIRDSENNPPRHIRVPNND